jgi:hypothetical protein
MWIEREIATEIKKAASGFPVVALVGPRQVGKTSILERLFPEYRYVSLDVATNAEAAETRPQAFVACPIDAPFDIEPGITAVSGWQVWQLNVS